MYVYIYIDRYIIIIYTLLYIYISECLFNWFGAVKIFLPGRLPSGWSATQTCGACLKTRILESMGISIAGGYKSKDDWRGCGNWLQYMCVLYLSVIFCNTKSPEFVEESFFRFDPSTCHHPTTRGKQLPWYLLQKVQLQAPVTSTCTGSHCSILCHQLVLDLGAAVLPM